MTLKYLLIIDFPKFDPLTAAGMALCVNLTKYVHIKSTKVYAPRWNWDSPQPPPAG